jgi:hypothetical protein
MTESDGKWPCADADWGDAGAIATCAPGAIRSAIPHRATTRERGMLRAQIIAQSPVIAAIVYS